MKINELHNQPVQPDTYEASMALNQLLKIGKHAIKIHNMIDDAAEMESWVAKKIDLAGDYVKKVHGYMQGEKAGLYDDGGMTEDEEIHPLWGDWGETPQSWSDTHVANNEDIVLAIAKGQIPPKEPTISGYMDEQNDAWPEGVEGGKYNDDQIVSFIEDTIGYECRSLGYDYFSKFTFGEVKDYYKPTPQQIKTAQEIVKDPEFAKARARIRGQAESVSEDAGEGHMSKSTLYHTAKYAIELMDMIKPGDDLEGWVQSKLNKAADYLQGVHNYEEYQKLNPYREELDSELLQRHAGIIQKNIDEILARETSLDDVDTKPGMMRILAKRVNEVEKEMAKENRKNTDEAHGGQHSSSGRSMTKGEMNKREKIVKGMKKNKAGFKKRYGKDAEAVMYATATKNAMKDAEDLEEGLKDWAKKTAMAGVIVAGLAGIGSIQDAIDSSIPAVQAMETALEMAQDQGNDELARMIEKDLSAVKVRLSSGKDLNFVKDMQEKYAKFIKTEGLAYESRLAVMLNQQLK